MFKQFQIQLNRGKYKEWPYWAKSSYFLMKTSIIAGYTTP